MPLIKSKSPEAFERNVSTLMGEIGRSPHVRSQAQALAIAHAIRRRGKADGGPVFERNRNWIKPGSSNFSTDLGRDEAAFLNWVRENRVPFDPSASSPQDYDMRGFWRALQAGDPRAASAINPNDNRLHFPDYWKTPHHESFSNESQWATQDAPRWNERDQLIDQGGNVVFDERARKADGGAIERLPDRYAEIGAANIEDRRNDDPTLRAMGISKLKKRFGMRHSDAMMDSQRTEAEVVDRLVPRGHADGGAVLAPGFYAQGGSPYPQMWQPMAGGGTPWEVKAEARGMVPHSGFIPGPTGGRADTVPMGVKKASYVVPADVVSGLGGGNSQAGAAALNKMFSAPYGAAMPKIGRAPKPRFLGIQKTAKPIRQRFADGGMSDAEPIADIIASHGEYVLSPQQLETRFGADLNLAHDAMDKFVENVRKDYAKNLRELPGPKAG